MWRQTARAVRGQSVRPARTALATALLLCMGTAVQAAEFGRARTLSGVGQPLRIEIPLQRLAPGETVSTLRVAVDAAQATDASLAQREPLRVEVAVRERGDAGLVLVIGSREPVGQPVADIGITLESRAGLQRRRLVLLLPPALHANVNPISLVLPSAPDTIVVQRGDTAGGIAQQLRTRRGYDGATLYQVLVALLQANPAAFIEGNMNRLRAGARLAVPDAATVLAVDAAQARQLYARHMAEFSAPRSRLVRGAPVLIESVAGDTASGQVQAATPAPPPAGRDELRLSSGAGTGGSQDQIDRLLDERAATQHALDEAQARADELESTVAEMQRLLGVQSAALARLQAAGAAGANAAEAGHDAALDADAQAAGAVRAAGQVGQGGQGGQDGQDGQGGQGGQDIEPGADPAAATGARAVADGSPEGGVHDRGGVQRPGSAGSSAAAVAANGNRPGARQSGAVADERTQDHSASVGGNVGNEASTRGRPAGDTAVSADTATGVVTVAGADTDTSAGAGTSPQAGAGATSAPDASTGAGAGTVTGGATAANASAGGVVGAGPDSGPGSGADTGTGTGTGTDIGSDTGIGPGTAAEAGVTARAGAGTAAGTDARAALTGGQSDSVDGRAVAPAGMAAVGGGVGDGGGAPGRQGDVGPDAIGPDGARDTIGAGGSPGTSSLAAMTGSDATPGSAGGASAIGGSEGAGQAPGQAPGATRQGVGLPVATSPETNAAVDSASTTADAGAEAQAPWLERYAWPMLALVLVFIAAVIAIVFRRRSSPSIETNAAAPPASGPLRVDFDLDLGSPPSDAPPRRGPLGTGPGASNASPTPGPAAGQPGATKPDPTNPDAANPDADPPGPGRPGA